MAYAKPPKRTDKEWVAFKHWSTRPVEAVKAWFNVTPDDWQGDMLTGIFSGTHDRVAVKAAHGPGKSAVDAWAGWVFLNCYEKSRVVATAPTFAQLHDVLFPEFAKWHGKMPEKMANEWNISGGHIRHKLYPYEWFGVARTSNKPANLQGFHNANLMIIGDEASAIPENVFEVIEGAMTEAGEEGKVAKLILNGNPNFTAGELFNAFGKNKELYHRITVTGDPSLLDELGIKQGDDHPFNGRVYYSQRVKKRYVDTMAKKYGADSAIFDVRVRGLFPRVSDECVIPYEWAARAMGREIPVAFDAVADAVTLVVDVARGGGAESVVGAFRRGYCYHMDAAKTSSTTACVNMVQEAIIKLIGDGLHLDTIIVDEPGVGGGVIDQLRSLGLPVTPYNGSMPMVIDQDPDEDRRMFANRRARDWWGVRRLLEMNLLPLPDDEVLLAQLTSIQFYYNAQEKIVIESKQDLKDRLGKDASPDRADVIVMGKARTYTAGEAHRVLREQDIICGADRPRMIVDC